MWFWHGFLKPEKRHRNYNGFHIWKSNEHHKLAFSLSGNQDGVTSQSASNQFTCLGNDMETSTHVCQF